MKKLSLLSIVSIIIVTFVNGQENTRRFSINVNAGPSIPLGRFAHSAVTISPHDTAGNATVGLAANISLQYALKKGWGLSLLIGGSRNNQDHEKYKTNLQQALGETTQITAVKMQAWDVFKVMPGVTYTLSFSAASAFQFKSMLSAGFCKTAIPSSTFSFKQDGSPNQDAMLPMNKSNLPAAFCYQLAAGLNYNINKRLFAAFDIAYFASSPVKTYEYNANPNPLSSMYIPASGKRHYSLTSLNALLGIGVRL